MRQVLRHLALGIGVSILATGGRAQPALTPAYAENFSASRQLPQPCISDVLIDRRGRLWAATCPVMAGVNSVRLFQFDGYDFTPVNLANDSLPDRTVAVLKQTMPDGSLLGWFEGSSLNALFFFDPDRQTTRIVAFQSRTDGVLRDIFPRPDGRVLAILEKTDSLLLFQTDPAGRKTRLLAWPHAVAGRPANSAVSREEMALYADGDAVWVACGSPSVVFQVNRQTGAVQRHSLPPVPPLPVAPPDVLSNRFAARFVVRPGGEMWCFLQGRIWRHNGRSFEMLADVPKGYAVCRMEQDTQGNVVLLLRHARGEYAGLLFDREGQRHDYSGFFKACALVYNLRSANFRQGIFICAEDGLSFKFTRQYQPVECVLPGHSIRGMAELSPGELVISSQNYQPVRFHLPSGRLETLPDTSPWVQAFGGAMLRNTNRSPEGRWWGNRGEILTCFDPGSGTHRDYARIPGLQFTTLLKDGRLALFCPEQGLLVFDPLSQQIAELPNCQRLRSFKGLINNMIQTRDERLWLLSTDGLWQISLTRGVEKHLGFEAPFRDFRFLCLEEAPDGQLWLGTFLGGVHCYDPRNGSVTVIDKEQGLPDNTVASITRDEAGEFWVATYRGLSRLSAEGMVLGNLLLEDGLCELEFNRYASLRTHDGVLLLGTVNGLHVIRPDLLAARRQAGNVPQIYLTGLTLADGSSTGSQTLRSGFDAWPLLVLPPDRRRLEVSFALSSYVQSERNQFAYRLEGLDEQWTAIGARRRLSFNDLPPGQYTLLIKGCDFQGNWTAEPLRIPIHARDFFYKQPWFYVLCLLPFLLIAWVWVRRLRGSKKRLEAEVMRRTQQIRRDKELIEQQARELRHLDEVKSRFFTNISHELRTPITLITGPANQLLRQYSGPDYGHLRQSLKRMLDNGRRLAELVEELLELSRLEAGKVELNETPTPFYPFCARLFSAFESQARFRDIDYTFDYTGDRAAWFALDRRRLEKIVNNLISNALKFTPPGGWVRVGVQADPLPGDAAARLTVCVTDSGRGIPPEDMPHVFERYFQTKRRDLPREGGTGIGLALARELSLLMKGRLGVESEWGKGSAFTLELPAVAVPPGPLPPTGPIPEAPPAAPAPAKNPAPNRAHLLVVEDNPDMRALLHAQLSEQYRLTLVNDGQAAWERLNRTEEPQDISLILSDVMMPRLDGYALLEKIKTHPKWQHLPVILLTARAEPEDRIQALRLGVDDYLVKPFSPEELEARLDNLIENYRRRRAFSEKHVTSLSFEPGRRADADWLAGIEKAAREALDKGLPLQVTQLAAAGAVSERQFFREIKRLTGLTPHRYILEVRLQKARHLLRQNTHQTLAELAYAVGFGTPGYFTRVFEKHFGKHPSAYFNAAGEDPSS